MGVLYPSRKLPSLEYQALQVQYKRPLPKEAHNSRQLRDQLLRQDSLRLAVSDNPQHLEKRLERMSVSSLKKQVKGVMPQILL
jgi:hypothetical protein